MVAFVGAFGWLELSGHGLGQGRRPRLAGCAVWFWGIRWLNHLNAPLGGLSGPIRWFWPQNHLNTQLDGSGSARVNTFALLPRVHAVGSV